MDNFLSRYVIKNSDKRNRNLKYDFMPPLLEIIERPSHIAGTVITITIAVLLVAAIVWASLSKLDVVVNGIGNVIPEGRLIDIQPLTGGRVENINVKVGDYVEAGTVLVAIENEGAKIDFEQLEYNIEWCKIRREITENRLENDEYEIDIDKYDTKFSNGINQLILEIDIYKEQKNQRQKDLEQAEKELDEAKNKGTEYMLETLESRVESYENNIKSSSVSQKSQMYSQLFSLDREMDGYDAQLKKFDISSDNFLIKSPVNGYVNMLSVASAGQTVSPGNNVVSIVPSDSEMQFECYVLDKDRAEISTGMNVTLKLSAFSFSDYGAVTGKVTYISPSAFANEKYGNVYVVNIDIDEDAMHSDIELTAGLSGNVEIVVGQRSVMRYFLDPIMGGLRESLKEN
jgi:multidrug efflux pump subunit AcrA (membrane-fusion protein)